MKTATVTLHTAHNNGSFLQAYALQKTIYKMGYPNKIINFVPTAQYSLYQNIIFKELSLKGLIKGALNIPHYNKLTKRKNRFNNVLDNLNLTDRFDEENKFAEVSQEYDCLIAGSDQIWNNASMPDFSNIYLLPVNQHKISYAPSFGKSLTNQFGSDIIESIKKFEYLSVREQSVKVALDKLIPEKRIQVVLDPTFLLEKNDYNELYNNADCKFDGDYIFFYCIKVSKEVLSTVKKISEMLNLPVVTVFTGVNTYKCQIYGQKVDFEAGPSEFIKYIHDAKYVISNSFHGIVFSIIYNKIFFRIADNDGGKIKTDERLDSILSLLELTKQNVIANTEIHLNKNIDFKVANDNLKKLKTDSLEWLQTSLATVQEEVKKTQTELIKNEK
ncbi:polysaccharide pyruvyl transferase family protein [Enterococcus faecium]|uniref:polysaccharide pyruvyl transferase family protein n=1 Tax=Enterococcus faecium TaxID=1352 RepID=UPI001A0A02A5|nr:polysaccharide pyruvyl transferase family protein [Enterococcus faecium]